MEHFNVKKAIEFEFQFDLELGENYIEVIAYNTDTDQGATIFRVYDDGSSEVLTGGLKNVGLDHNPVIF
jgi:hypothetical protein